MASLTDFLNSGNSGEPLGFQMATMVPQYRVNETMPNLQEDASIAGSRLLQDYATRTMPDIANQGAALGQTGSSGLNNRASRAQLDMQRQSMDINRMLYRNMASIAQQKVMATMGSMF